MTPLVVVQNNHVRRLTDPAALAAHALGIALHDVSSGDEVARRPLPEGGPFGPVLVIGSTLFAHQWAGGRPDLLRWVDWDDAAYDAARWAGIFDDRFLNHAGRSTTIGALIDESTPPVHIRPRDGMKLVGVHPPSESRAGQRSVAGLVVDAADLVAQGFDPEVAVWAAPPVRIDAEVRVWMVGGKPAARSTYRIADEHVRLADHPLCAPAEAAAQAICDIFSPGRAFVCDVALSEGAWRLVEFNPIHSSGWYAADPAAIISAWFEAEATR